METDKSASRWQGGKSPSEPQLRKSRKVYVARPIINGKEIYKSFTWGDKKIYKNQEEAYIACKEYIYKICKENATLFNEYRYVNNDVIKVKLNYNNTTKFMIVDAEYLDKVEKYVWCACKRGHEFYAEAAIKVRENSQSIKFHQLITNFKYKTVDHINGIRFYLYLNQQVLAFAIRHQT